MYSTGISGIRILGEIKTFKGKKTNSIKPEIGTFV